MKLVYDEIESPIGRLLLVCGDRGVIALEFDRSSREFGGDLVRAANPRGVSEALRAYFAGDLHALDAVEVDSRGTPFQQRVWAELRKIPVGATRSYADIARAVAQPTATRAVGAANGRNPVAVIVPCHRVIGADGTLTGYGGGLARKRWLLAHEGIVVPLRGAAEDRRCQLAMHWDCS